MATEGKNLSSYNKDELHDASELRIGLVVSEWNGEITEALYQGARETLIDCGVLEINIIRWNVPGSFELTFGCKKMLRSQQVDAIIAIGSVIRGETSHFDFVCQGVSQGIKDLNVQFDKPTIFCVLTDDTEQQAIDRSGGKHGNKGAEAAIAAIKMATLGQ
ncbi:6,7-dimethyl-8-ribityllumazine synthase [Allomuricauda sp. SCSIO 65647]|uniref:6,7-dimethyl-8-ribityllumazine synthase n=1 Tax=Allomuricauda sp. SCSIO 65647 TaxID=2908843 RepID=UPI001EFF612F|nr:6,7-dimethyl-8-ribityllumazine synthase [Muricauda sp. SCSIO 65647]UJH67896.1 6,7-dimethyl-8-ribityllumazine synthase [Muricauda sp. SCSIO 65647]